MKQSKMLKPTLFLFSLVLFLTLLVMVKFTPTLLQPFDKSIASLIQSNPNPVKLNIFKSITQIGNQVPFTVINFAIVLILVWKKYMRYSFFLIVATFGGSLINHLIKEWVQRPRPTPRLISAAGYSFPSGHSVAAATLFGGLIIITNHVIKNKSIKFILTFIWVVGLILLPVSRVYLNVHYPSDIIGGLLLGFVVLLISNFILIKE